MILFIWRKKNKSMLFSFLLCVCSVLQLYKTNWIVIGKIILLIWKETKKQYFRLQNESRTQNNLCLQQPNTKVANTSPRKCKFSGFHPSQEIKFCPTQIQMLVLSLPNEDETSTTGNKIAANSGRGGINDAKIMDFEEKKREGSFQCVQILVNELVSVKGCGDHRLAELLAS